MWCETKRRGWPALAKKKERKQTTQGRGWREQLQLFSPALLRARRRASVPTLQHSPSIHSREATRPHARPRPHLLCFNVLPWSQRASRHDSIAMAGALWTATVRGRCAAARAGAAQIRALAPSIQFPHSVVVVLSARTARTAIQRLVDSAQSPRRIRESRAHRLDAQSAAAVWTSPMDRVCGRDGQSWCGRPAYHCRMKQRHAIHRRSWNCRSSGRSASGDRWELTELAASGMASRICLRGYEHSSKRSRDGTRDAQQIQQRERLVLTQVTGEVLGAEPALTLPIHRIATRLLIPVNCWRAA